MVTHMLALPWGAVSVYLPVCKKSIQTLGQRSDFLAIVMTESSTFSDSNFQPTPHPGVWPSPAPVPRTVPPVPLELQLSQPALPPALATATVAGGPGRVAGGRDGGKVSRDPTQFEKIGGPNLFDKVLGNLNP